MSLRLYARWTKANEGDRATRLPVSGGVDGGGQRTRSACGPGAATERSARRAGHGRGRGRRQPAGMPARRARESAAPSGRVSLRELLWVLRRDGEKSEGKASRAALEPVLRGPAGGGVGHGLAAMTAAERWGGPAPRRSGRPLQVWPWRRPGGGRRAARGDSGRRQGVAGDPTAEQGRPTRALGCGPGRGAVGASRRPRGSAGPAPASPAWLLFPAPASLASVGTGPPTSSTVLG